MHASTVPVECSTGTVSCSGFWLGCLADRRHPLAWRSTLRNPDHTESGESLNHPPVVRRADLRSGCCGRWSGGGRSYGPQDHIFTVHRDSGRRLKAVLVIPSEAESRAEKVVHRRPSLHLPSLATSRRSQRWSMTSLQLRACPAMKSVAATAPGTWRHWGMQERVHARTGVPRTTVGVRNLSMPTTSSARAAPLLGMT